MVFFDEVFQQVIDDGNSYITSTFKLMTYINNKQAQESLAAAMSIVTSWADCYIIQLPDFTLQS